MHFLAACSALGPNEREEKLSQNCLYFLQQAEKTTNFGFGVCRNTAGGFDGWSSSQAAGDRIEETSWKQHYLRSGPRLLQVLDPLESVCRGPLIHLLHLVHLVLPGLALEEAVDKQSVMSSANQNADPMYKTRMDPGKCSNMSSRHLKRIFSKTPLEDSGQEDLDT